MRPGDRDLFGEHRRPASRASGLGLRGQITFALVVALGLSVTLVAIAVDRLASRALEQERERAAELGARGAAALVQRVDAPDLALDRAEDALFGASRVVGLAIVGEDGQVRHTRGEARGVAAEAPISGGRVRVWVASAVGGDASGGALVRLVALYAAITSVAMLVLCYVLLTHLIVRPVEALTRASEQLAAGRESARSRVQGAAEVQRLALSFNAMADDLRDERAALRERLEQLERATNELRAAQDSLLRSEKLASVGRLAAGVAHEIGNPLSAILGLLELVRGGGLEPGEQDEFLHRIQHETERIHRIIRDLLDYSAVGRPSAPDAGGAASDLGEVVESAVHLVAPQKDLRRISIERRIPEALPPVRGEADALTQLVLNLLLNAADAIEGEGEITIALAVEDDAVVVTLDDTGPGIAPEVRDRLFEPFVTTKPSGSGTGLGLAVCWTIVERVGGTIAALEAPSGGARFSVRLPRADRRGAGDGSPG